VSWYLHAVEGTDGRWSCQHGRTIVDSHEDRTCALTHLKLVACELGIGTAIFAHTRAGTVERVE
jgi:hypothetical protein